MKRRGVPLARALSKLGLATRSEARELILAGQVVVPRAFPVAPARHLRTFTSER